MASRVLVTGLPRSLPPLPPGPAPTCVPCIKGQQRAAPHSFEFPPTEAPLQTLHIDVWGPARVRGQDHERYFLLVVDDYSRYTTVFPLRRKGEVTEVLIDWIRAARRQLSESFGSDLPVLRQHSDRGREFCSDLLRAFCRAEGICQTFTLPASLQQNGIAERHIGMVMDVAPFIRDLSADKLSSCAVPCVFFGLLPDAPGWQFYHPTSRCVLSSQDVTFDKSVPYYCLSPYRTAPLPPLPLFLTPGPPPVDPLPPQGPAPSGVSQVDAVEPVEVAVDSSAARGVEPTGARSRGAEPERAEPGGAESGGAEPGVAEAGSAEPEGAELARVESGGAAPGGPSGASSRRAAGAGGATGAGGSIAAGAAGGSGVTGAAGLGGAPGARAGGTTGAGAAGGTGAGATGATKASGGSAGAGGAAGAGTPGGAGVGATGAGRGAVGAGGVGPNTGGAGAVPAGSGGAARPRPYFVLLLEQFLSLPPSTGPVSSLECPPPVQSQSHLQPASPLPAPSPYTGPTGGLTARREPESRLVSPVRAARTSRRGLRQRPPPAPGTHQMALRPSSAPQRVPLPSPPASSLPALADPPSDLARAASPTSESVCPPSVGGECALSKDVLEDKQEEFQCFAAALPHLVSMLLTLEGDPDALDIPTPRSYAEAIEGPYSSQWQTAMDAEMASWKSTSTYVDEVPPPGVNIVDGMWIFRVKRSPGSPPVFKARYVARGFSQWQGVDYFQTFSPTPKMTTLWVLLHVAAQRDYELHSLDFSTAFLQGSLHEEIWLRRPPGFIGTTLAALGFAPSTVYPSLFLRTDTTLPSFYILVYVDDLVFASADTAGLTLVKSELQKRHTCTDLGELRSYLGLQITQDRARHTITLTQSHMVRQVLQRFNFTYSSPQATPLSTRHSLSALPSDESVEPSGPYLELVGCLITSGMGLVLGGQARVVLTGHANSSWVDDLATLRSSQGYTFSLGSGSVSWWSTRSSSVLSSSCEAEIYARAMAVQELPWLTYLLSDLGEAPHSPPILYVDNKAMLALCPEHRLEHRTKHIALRYFLARELQQCGQLRLAYVAPRANTADIFTKALQPCDHQRFCTMLACFALLDWSCDLLFSPTLPMGPSVQESLSPQQRCDWASWWGSPGGKASRARAGGAGVGGPCTRRREPLSSQQLRKRAVRWGSPAGGAWCATTGGPYESTPAGSAAGESTPAGSATGRHGGSGGGQQRQQRPPETLSPQQLPEWAVRWGSPGSGAWGTSAGGGEAPGCVDAASLGAFDSSAIGAEP
ncbi:unnamed protein product [Closterium sp. NIES-53]